jgi:hypothetical protein
VTPEEILLWVAGVQMPKADTGRVRTAAGYYRQLADAVEGSKTAMDKVANEVKAHNKGAGATAFDGAYFGPAPQAAHTLTDYPQQVAAYLRQVAQSNDDFANVIDEVRDALWVLAIQVYANILFTIFYGWLTGFLETSLVEARIMVLVARIKAYDRIKDQLIGLITKRLVYTLVDSLAYAGGQQLLQAGIYRTSIGLGVDQQTLTKVAGYDPFSVKANGIQFADGFVGNAAYDGVADALPGLAETSKYRQKVGKYFLRQPGIKGAVGGLTTRMIASNVYTYAGNVTDSYLEGDGNGWTKLPTAHQEAAKLFIHVPRVLVKYPLNWKNWPSISGQVGGVGTP